MRRKIAATSFLLAVSFMICINMTSANDEVYFYAHTNKPYYEYGDQGTLFITVRNNETGPIAVKSIRVRFPWGSGWYHEQWSGDYTEDIPSEEQTVNENDTQTYSVQFTVPSETRDEWGLNAEIWATYVYGDETDTQSLTIPINVAIPVYNENIMPIYYLTAVLTTAVIVVIIELYFVWRRLGRLTATPAAP